ncbi:MAG TPA: M13 family metallopeptidase, partial [Gemmataceae bacterium]|nr:M13 family metallopeptidase [Gemmataceae bacterium]
MHRQRTALVILMLLLVAAAGTQIPADAPHAPAPRSGVDLKGMDPSVEPYEDFYKFANGKWLAAASIPADRPSIAMFTLLQDHNREVLHRILKEAANDDRPVQGSLTAKVGAFYRSGMDERKIEAAGAKPLRRELDRIDAVHDAAGLVRAIARLHGYRVATGFRFGPSPDLKDSTRMIGGLSQGGLGLPDREYYLKSDNRTKAIRSAYVTHIEKMLALLGDGPEHATARARAVLAFETRLARASKTRVELRDPKANYHLMTLKELENQAPGIAWKSYFRDLGLGGLKAVDLGQPAFFKEVGRMATAVPLDDWKAYLRWHLLNAHADKLSAAFVAENFHFHGSVLTGVPKMRPRWQRVLEATDHLLGDALGQMYVKRAFPPKARARAEVLVRNVKAALRERLATLDWMSPATRREALRKLDAVLVKIGYPSKWRDYSGLAVDRDVYVGNVMQAEVFAERQQLAKVGKPVDRTEWHMTPPTVNAYYEASQNEIVFPAGILQPPFFDPNADDAVNYGGIGMVIGHELTHGFDDHGRQFDGDGNLRDWWTPQDEKTYKQRAAEIASQYDGYVVVDKLHINGQLTLGENIADLGGLKIAYLALHKALEG